jgi:hypothetical protein
MVAVEDPQRTTSSSCLPLQALQHVQQLQFLVTTVKNVTNLDTA